MLLHVVTVGSFLALASVAFLVGRLMIPGLRNRAEDIDAVGGRRPPALGALTESLAAVFPLGEKKRQQLKGELVRAGYYHRGALDEFLALRNSALMAWILFVACALVLVVGQDEPWTRHIVLLGGGVAILLYALPRLVLGSQAGARTLRIQYALPDALDMITMTMSGGMPMQKALERVSREMRGAHPDLACELAIISRQTEAGSLEQAMKQFSKRFDIPDVVGLTALVRHTERLGSPIAETFRQYADNIRGERRQRAEERGNKATVKLLFPIVFCLAPPIYILLLGPAVLEMRNFMTRENQPGGVLSQQLSGASSAAARPRR